MYHAIISLGDLFGDRQGICGVVQAVPSANRNMSRQKNHLPRVGPVKVVYCLVGSRRNDWAEGRLDDGTCTNKMEESERARGTASPLNNYTFIACAYRATYPFP
jgi:hypothetical protein